MEPLDDRLDLERQLRSLRLGLKAVCIPLSLSVLLATWYSLGRTALTKSLVVDMGNFAVPGIVEGKIIQNMMQ